MLISQTEKIFKKNLIILREKKGVSIYRAALDSKIDKAYYYRLEDRKRHIEPKFETLEKLSLYFNIPVYKLFMDEVTES